MIRLGALSFLLVSISCTSNPFWEDAKKNELTLSGIVHAENNETGIPVSIWVETLDLYTTTEPDGVFSIPIPNTQSNSGTISGPVKLYFFIHNYSMDSATVYFTNGVFSRDQTDFSTDGQLLNTIELKKIFSGTVELHFGGTSLSFRDTVRLSFHLNIHSSVSIDAYKFTWAHNDFHSGIIFRALDDDTVATYRYSITNESGMTIEDEIHTLNYPHDTALTWTYYILSDSLDLPVNAYEVLPYFLIGHEYFPDGLASAFGGDPTFTISEHYLKLPSDIVSDTLTID